MFVVVIAHLVVAVVAFAGGRLLGRRAFLWGALAPAASVVWAATQVGSVRDGTPVREALEWVPELGIVIELRLDGFALLMVSLVSGVGTLVFLYAYRYYGPSVEAPGRLAGVLVLFAGSMLGLVLADNLIWLYVCWELTSITSYLLIGHEDRRPEARASALQALLITGTGGLAMLGGFVLLGVSQGTFRISELVADPMSGGLVTAASILVLLGAFTKSAQVPFHSWLPGAMVASTPISAYLHSAAMVKAGIFLVLRLGPAFAATEVWRPAAVTVGLATMLVGGVRALRQDDLKLLLAYGTVSQLGLMMALAGLGHPEAVVAACALLIAHAAFKAALFMIVGVIDHQTHTRDLRQLGRYGPGWRPTMWVAVVSAASMAGIVPLAGFIAKEAAIEAVAHGDWLASVALVGIVAGSMLTVAYSARFVWGTCVPKQPAVATHGAPIDASPPSAWFLAPPAALTIVTVGLGVWTKPFAETVQLASRAIESDAESKLALWHGVNQALVLSIVAVAGGLLLFAVRDRVDPLLHRLRSPWTAAGGFDASMRALTTTATRVTSIAQPGSLPMYAGIILLTAAAVPGFALLTLGEWPAWPEWLATAEHLPVAALVMGGAIAAVLARRRFAAAIFLGVVGYGMTLLFVVQGAPDLALTQLSIETLTVVLFMLVLRFLPDRFEHRGAGLTQGFRIVVAAAVGMFVFAMIVIASAARTEPSVSGAMVDQSLPKGGGRNVVNVILVDFRGLDTLGEITVLVVASIGAVTLARVGRRGGPGAQAPARDAETPVDSTAARMSEEVVR